MRRVSYARRRRERRQLGLRSVFDQLMDMVGTEVTMMSRGSAGRCHDGRD